MKILPATLPLLFVFPQLALGGWGNNDDGALDETIYGDSFTRDWLYDSSAISMKLEGCVWGYVYDNEESGCLEDSSEDGTTSWYQMANCRRAQAAFSLYATDSRNSAGCSSNTYKETFVTKTGVSEFIGWLQENDENNPFGDNGNDDGDNYWNIDELPMCEQAEDGYLGLGCNSDGTFSINTFYDQYCLTSTGVYDTLDKLNYQLKNYKNCVGLSVANGNDDGGGGGNNNNQEGLPALLYYAESCSASDSGICIDDAYMESRRSSASSGSSKRKAKTQSATRSWHTKLKYALGAMLLVASFVMFTGILFTNRRRRRALMQRKYRQSRRADRSRKSSRSKSRDKRSRSSRRSKSKGRDKVQTEAQPASGGVFT